MHPYHISNLISAIRQTLLPYPTIMVQEMLKIIILGLETEKVDGL